MTINGLLTVNSHPGLVKGYSECSLWPLKELQGICTLALSTVKVNSHSGLVKDYSEYTLWPFQG